MLVIYDIGLLILIEDAELENHNQDMRSENLPNNMQVCLECFEHDIYEIAREIHC